jgi:hypothetical protein
MEPAFYRETEVFVGCGSLAAAFLSWGLPNGWKCIISKKIDICPDTLESSHAYKRLLAT